jgi:hypothetical protein
MKIVTKMAHFKENLMKTFFSLRYIDEDRFNRALSSWTRLTKLIKAEQYMETVRRADVVGAYMHLAGCAHIPLASCVTVV